MTSLLAGARKLVARSPDVGARIEGLDAAVASARGRVDDALLQDVAEVVERSASRLRLSADHTVVGLAGATGSGKSSTFNAIIGLDLAAVGVRRPTTSWATACVWGTQGADEVLDWLGIPERHRTVRDSMLDVGRADEQLEGVVLLDLPDHDSTEVSHHLEVDRLVQLADLMVWVLDPQKYADAAIHDRYLAPLSAHRDVMVIVLNHIDTVPESRRQAMVDDVRRLLDQDGLGGVPVHAVSARDKIGMDDLKAEIARRVSDKRLARSRMAGDLRAAAERLDEATGRHAGPWLPPERVDALEDALAEAAGVPTVVSAVEASTRLRANRETGWPVLSWVSRLRRDPLKRLHLDLGRAGTQLVANPRTSMPEATTVQRARVDTEVRALADEVSVGLGRSWATAVRRASTAHLGDLGDRLDAALGSTDLGVSDLPWWTRGVRVLQWALILAALTGMVWLASLALLGYLQVGAPDVPSYAGLPLPTLLLVGGVGLGILLALVCRWLVSVTARARARSVDQRLRAAIHEVSQDLVVAPVEAELAAHRAVRDGLDRALA